MVWGNENTVVDGGVTYHYSYTRVLYKVPYRIWAFRWWQSNCNTNHLLPQLTENNHSEQIKVSGCLFMHYLISVTSWVAQWLYVFNRSLPCAVLWFHKAPVWAMMTTVDAAGRLRQGRSMGCGKAVIRKGAWATVFSGWCFSHQEMWVWTVDLHSTLMQLLSQNGAWAACGVVYQQEAWSSRLCASFLSEQPLIREYLVLFHPSSLLHSFFDWYTGHTV